MTENPFYGSTVAGRIPRIESQQVSYPRDGFFSYSLPVDSVLVHCLRHARLPVSRYIDMFMQVSIAFSRRKIKLHRNGVERENVRVFTQYYGHVSEKSLTFCREKRSY